MGHSQQGRPVSSWEQPSALALLVSAGRQMCLPGTMPRPFSSPPCQRRLLPFPWSRAAPAFRQVLESHKILQTGVAGGGTVVFCFNCFLTSNWEVPHQVHWGAEPQWILDAPRVAGPALWIHTQVVG